MGVHNLCLITFDSSHCDSFEPVPGESTLRCGTKLIWISSRKDEAQQSPPLLSTAPERSWANARRSETLARGLSVLLLLLQRWESAVGRVGGGQSSHSICFRPEHVPVCPLSSCNLRDGTNLHLSAQVSDVIGYRLRFPPPTQPTQPTSLKCTHTHSS